MLLFMRKVIARAPFGGTGLCSGPASGFQAKMSSLYWLRIPALWRPAAVLTAKVIWIFACLIRWRQALAQLDRGADRWGILRESLLSGKSSSEIILQRKLFPNAAEAIIPQRSADAAFRFLGDARQKEWLRDKLEMAERLLTAAIPVPPTLMYIRSEADMDLASPVWSAGASLVVKPRHGFGGKGVFLVDTQADGRFLIDQTRLLDRDGLRHKLQAALHRDCLLVQPRLKASHNAGHGALGRLAPVLRLTTRRAPGGAALVHDSYLSVFMPGSKAADWRFGVVRFPADPRTGMLLDGLWLAQPGLRFAALPWNDHPMAGALFPQFEAAVAMAVRAADLVPGLAVVGWDIILTDDGPIMLEGNSGLDWMLSNLWHLQTGHPSPLADVLLQWHESHR